MIRYESTEVVSKKSAYHVSDLSPDQQTRLKQITGRIQKRHRMQIQAIIQTGEDLLRVKEILAHGAFLDWLEAEFGWSRKTAHRYMTAAQHFSGRSDMVTHLSPSALYELAAPSTPDHVRRVIEKGLQRGKPFHADDIKNLVRRSGRPSISPAKI